MNDFLKWRNLPFDIVWLPEKGRADGCICHYDYDLPITKATAKRKARNEAV